MKQYEMPKIVLILIEQDVVTYSTEMASYDDKGFWKTGWTNLTGGSK